MHQRPLSSFRPKKDSYNLKADFEYLKENNYNVVKQIDRGSYGVVYKAEDRNSGGFVAIKINFNIISREQLYVEMGLLSLMRTKKKLPYLHQIIEKKGTYSIVMDYYKSQPFITFFNRVSILDVKHYIHELLLGLKELKQLGIYHRDIKPSNFLYDEANRKGVIVDYGLAEIDPDFVKRLKQKVLEYEESCHELYEEYLENLTTYENVQQCLLAIGKNKIGTQIFMPPESVLKMQNQSYSSDIWPVGIILLQFVAKRFNIFSTLPKLQQFCKIQKSYHISFLLQLGCLFGKQNVIDHCRNVFKYQLKLPEMIKQINLRDICIIENFDDTCYDLLTKMLTIDPKNRITVQKALEHPFFQQLNQS